MSNPDGGPAFPFAATDPSNVALQAQGMSLRDYFAAQALPTLYATAARNNELNYPGWRDDLVCEAYRLADAMLAERNKS